jgi:hypothetical protein
VAPFLILVQIQVEQAKLDQLVANLQSASDLIPMEVLNQKEGEARKALGEWKKRKRMVHVRLLFF